MSVLLSVTSSELSSVGDSASVSLSAAALTARHTRLFQALAAVHIDLNPAQQAAVAKAARLDILPTVQDLHTASYAVRALLALWVMTPPKHMHMLDMLSVAFGMRSLHAAQAMLPSAHTPSVTPWSYQSVPVALDATQVLHSIYEHFPVLTLLANAGTSVVFTEAVSGQPSAWTDGTTLYLPAADFQAIHYTSVAAHALLDHPTVLAQALEDPSIDPHLFALALDIRTVFTFVHTPQWLNVKMGDSNIFKVFTKRHIDQLMTTSLGVVYTHAFMLDRPHKLEDALAFWAQFPTPMDVYRVVCSVRDGTYTAGTFAPLPTSMVAFVRTVASGSYASTSWAPSVVLPTQHARVHARSRAVLLDLCTAMYTSTEKSPSAIQNFSTSLSASVPCPPFAVGDAVFSGPSWTRVEQVMAVLQTIDHAHATAPNTDAHHQALADILRGTDVSDIARLVVRFLTAPLNSDMYDFACRLGWALHLADLDWAAHTTMELTLAQILQSRLSLDALFTLPAYLMFADHKEGFRAISGS